MATNQNPAPQPSVKAASLSEIREALRDQTIASYPDFVAAVTSAIDELASRRKARTYAAGRADGHAEAINQAAGEAYRVCAETRHVTLGESAARAIRAIDPSPQPNVVPSADEIDALIERLLDAQQDINLSANETMSQPLCDASALIDEVEKMLRRVRAIATTEGKDNG